MNVNHYMELLDVVNFQIKCLAHKKWQFQMALEQQQQKYWQRYLKEGLLSRGLPRLFSLEYLWYKLISSLECKNDAFVPIYISVLYRNSWT